MKPLYLKSFAWFISAIVAFLAVLVWSQSLHGTLTSYTLFPLFGLLAFSLMWAHYVASVARQISGGDKSQLSFYFESTSLVVLIAIFVHPGLLIYQLYRDGFGLPPQSYLQHYVAPGMKWVALLGTVSFFVFLSYELRRWYGNRSWWKFVSYATDIAILAVFYHGLKLGRQLQSGWFQNVWYVYGVILAACLIYIHTIGRTRKQKEQ
jgi:hypothetical protein